MDSVSKNQLHFLLIPLFSQGHMIPLTDLAKALAQRNQLVSIITTPVNSLRYEESIRSGAAGIRLVSVEFPGPKLGLPLGCENMESLYSGHSGHTFMEFFEACALMKNSLEEVIQGMETSPHCIVSTNALPWTQELADSFKIPRYVFETVSCFTIVCIEKLEKISKSETFSVPDIPHRIEFTKSRLPEVPHEISVQINQSRVSARGSLLNTFHEMEDWYVEAYKKERRNVWCIGPVSLWNKNSNANLQTGNGSSTDENFLISWLDSRNPKSVIYICFGSRFRISTNQIKQIALGLESSKFCFVWIVPKLDPSHEVEEWFKQENYEERVEQRGLIIRGWAPQVLILSHPSVGAFLTHCGWNSTLEGITAGLPMITWPMFAEQFFNENFIINVVRIGVKVGARQCVKPGEDDEETIVKWDQVKKSIEVVMDEGEEGSERRVRAKKLGEMAKKAVQKGGSSWLNVSFLIQDVLDHAHMP